MKNIIKLSGALAAALCIISCNEKIGSELPESGDYITVTADAPAQTKAGYESQSVLPGNFYMEINDPAFAGWMTKASGNEYSFPSGSTGMKWSDSNHSDVIIKAMTQPLGSNDIDRNNPMTVKVQKNQNDSDGTAVKESDLLGAKTGNGIEIRSSNIHVHFNHMFSKLYVKYNTSSDVKVNSVSVNNICVEGKFSYADMSVGDASALGDIDMYHNTSDHTAEAVFFPYTPGSDPKLSVTVNGKTLDPLPISLAKVGGKFLPGKRYIMNVTVSGSKITGAEVSVSDWAVDNSSIQMTGEKVLWIGTSIPAGTSWFQDAVISYPDMVDAAMNCEIANFSRPGSCVTKQDNTDWIATNGWNYLTAGGLAQTKKEAEDLYKEYLQKNYPNSWETELALVQSLSYESLIIPFIDGTQANCTVVVIDHGYNDRHFMVNEAGAIQTHGERYHGEIQLKDLAASYGNQEKLESYRDYITDIDEYSLSEGSSYILAMSRIIKAIKDVNPNIKIIIGNYFTLTNPLITEEFNHLETPLPFPSQYVTNIICAFNEAVAGLHNLKVVNVYEYLDSIDEGDFPANITYNPTQGYHIATEDMDPSKFCPDGVHPTNPAAIAAIAEVYVNELDGIIGSRN